MLALIALATTSLLAGYKNHTPTPLLLTAEQIAGPFKSICLEHVESTPDQIRAAISLPWKFEVQPARVAGRSSYRRESAMLSLRQAQRACSLTALAQPSVTLATMQSELGNIVPVGNWKPLLENDSSYVLIELDQTKTGFAISLKVSSQSGKNLATLSVEQIKDQ